ncbi:MAG: hypothetical protein GY835_02235 [bacterium]|nr:hypothetical protein [bacterium]
MTKYQVIWYDYEDDCSHCAVFESSEKDPLLAAQAFLAKLGNLAQFGYEIETAKTVDSTEPVGHRF